MTPESISRAEFDRRLEASTRRMREQRLGLEARAAALEDLIAQYSSALERLEADALQGTDATARQDALRALLMELATRTSAVAASL